LWLNLAVKALPFGLLRFSVFSDLQRFNGKAMTTRALTQLTYTDTIGDLALAVPGHCWVRR